MNAFEPPVKGSLVKLSYLKAQLNHELAGRPWASYLLSGAQRPHFHKEDSSNPSLHSVLWGLMGSSSQITEYSARQIMGAQ